MDTILYLLPVLACPMCMAAMVWTVVRGLRGERTYAPALAPSTDGRDRPDERPDREEPNMRSRREELDRG